MNPWLVGLWFASALALLAGGVLTSSNADPSAWDHDPIALALGQVALLGGAILATGGLVAGAITWQMRR